jgi:hypothetical protein
MPYFESSFQHDTAEIINLRRILELCNLPNVGPSPLDPQLSSESRCTNALTTLEKTISVFDDAFYKDAVFIEEMDEDIIEAELWDAAREKGVPEDHFPAKCIRNPPPCPVSPTLDSVLAPQKPHNIGQHLELPSIQIQPERLGSLTTVAPKPSPRTLSLTLSFRKSSRSSSSINSRPTSPQSFFSTFSRSSSTSAQPRRTRESLINLFRRDYKAGQRPAPLDETRAWSPPPPTDSDAPSLQSVRTNSQISSSPSVSVSSRTSTSSFADLSLYSWIDGRTLQKCAKNPRFVLLRNRCVSEARRFVDFAQHQRVALPLFLGRSRMYLDGRMKIRIEKLKKTVSFLLA